MSKIKYLRYHYEFFLNEIYIFEKRVERMLTLIEKRCKKANFDAEMKRIAAIKDAMEKSFAGVLDIRGKHIHLRRYENKKISQIEHLERYSLKEFDFIAHYSDLEYKQYRRKIKREIDKGVKGLENLFNKYLGDNLGDIIFEKLTNFYKKIK